MTVEAPPTQEEWDVASPAKAKTEPKKPTKSAEPAEPRRGIRKSQTNG